MAKKNRVSKARETSQYRESTEDGIPDWDKKRAAFELIFNAYGDKELVAKIVGQNKNDDEYIANVVGSLKSYYDHKPKTHREFFNRLAAGIAAWLKQHGQVQVINGRTIIECAYDELYELIPRHARMGFPPPSKQSDDIQMLTSTIDLDAIDHPIWVSRTYSIEAAKDGLQRGRIDQRVYYLNPDSAEYWKDLISSEQYNQYTECKEALEALVKKPVWTQFFEQTSNDGVVMLGGGSPTKDLVLIKSLLTLKPEGTPIHYALVDISQYMLMSAFKLVDSTLRQMQVRSRVQLNTLGWDFMDLLGARHRLRREGKNVAWVLPGGTIGNLDELRFFESIALKSVAGDLVIVGAEIKGAHNFEKMKELLNEKYLHPAFRNFVVGPLRSIWHNLDGARSFHDALDNLKIDVVDGPEFGHSRVPGSISVEVSVEVANRKVVLLTSTRYDEIQLIEYARKRAFELVDTTASTRNPEFKHFALKRT